MKNKSPEIIKGDVFPDDRGELSFNNAFDLSPIKRMYISNTLTKV